MTNLYLSGWSRKLGGPRDFSAPRAAPKMRLPDTPGKAFSGPQLALFRMILLVMGASQSHPPCSETPKASFLIRPP